MELQREQLGEHPHVHHVGEHAIALVHQETGYQLERSFILTETRIIENWAVSDATALTPETIEPILQLEPEVVILGTGRQQVFPPQHVMVEFLHRNIGIEPMDNRAAARTHSILVSEERERIVAAFILG